MGRGPKQDCLRGPSQRWQRLSSKSGTNHFSLVVTSLPMPSFYNGHTSKEESKKKKRAIFNKADRNIRKANDRKRKIGFITLIRI